MRPVRCQWSPGRTLARYGEIVRRGLRMLVGEPSCPNDPEKCPDPFAWAAPLQQTHAFRMAGMEEGIGGIVAAPGIPLGAHLPAYGWCRFTKNSFVSLYVEGDRALGAMRYHLHRVRFP
jgi:hypothetical protein